MDRSIGRSTDRGSVFSGHPQENIDGVLFLLQDHILIVFKQKSNQ